MNDCYYADCELYKNNEHCMDNITFCEKSLLEHDKEIRNKVIDDMIAIINSMKETAQAMMWDREEYACDRFIDQAKKLKKGDSNE